MKETPLERSGREARERVEKYSSPMSVKSKAILVIVALVLIGACMAIGGALIVIMAIGFFAAITGTLAYWGIR